MLPMKFFYNYLKFNNVTNVTFISLYLRIEEKNIKRVYKRKFRHFTSNIGNIVQNQILTTQICSNNIN